MFLCTKVTQSGDGSPPLGGDSEIETSIHEVYLTGLACDYDTQIRSIGVRQPGSQSYCYRRSGKYSSNFRVQLLGILYLEVWCFFGVFVDKVQGLFSYIGLGTLLSAFLIIVICQD